MDEPARPLRVLHLIRDSGRGDVALHAGFASRLIRGQHAAGLELAVIAPEVSPVRQALAGLEGIEWPEGFALFPATHWRRVGRDVRALRAWFGGRAPDIVHAHDTRTHWLAARTLRAPWLGRRELRPAVVRSLWTIGRPRRGPLHRWQVGKGSDFVIVANEADRRTMVEQVGLPPPKVQVMPPPVPLPPPPAERRGPARERLGLPADVPVVGLAGYATWFFTTRPFGERLRAHVSDLLRRLPADHADLHLLIASARGDHASMAEFVAGLELGERVRVVDGGHDDAMNDFNAALDLVIGDGQGLLQVLDAMAAGTAVVLPLADPTRPEALEAWPLAEPLRSGEIGWAVPAEPPESLILTVIEALSDRERLTARGAAARAAVEARLAPDTARRLVDAYYEEALARRARALGLEWNRNEVKAV